MTASRSPRAIFDATGQPQGPLVLGMVLFAGVVPAALFFRQIEGGSGPRTVPAREHLSPK